MSVILLSISLSSSLYKCHKREIGRTFFASIGCLFGFIIAITRIFLHTTGVLTFFLCNSFAFLTTIFWFVVRNSLFTIFTYRFWFHLGLVPSPYQALLKWMEYVKCWFYFLVLYFFFWFHFLNARTFSFFKELGSNFIWCDVYVWFYNFGAIFQISQHSPCFWDILTHVYLDKYIICRFLPCPQLFAVSNIIVVLVPYSLLIENG